jgi:hypothetical protein
MRKRDLKARIDALDARLAEAERQVASMRRDEGRGTMDASDGQPSYIGLRSENITLHHDNIRLQAEVDTLKAELSVSGRRPAPDRGIVIERNDRGDGWMATFHGFAKGECGREAPRGSATSVGEEVFEVMRSLDRRYGVPYSAPANGPRHG